MTRFEVTGLSQLTKALRQAGELAETALAAAMVEEQEAVITQAKEAAPVDTGTLRASGTVLSPEVSAGSITVEAGFGGAAKAYAIVQHERHSSKSKFLERPFLARAPRIPANLARKVTKAWERLRVR